MIQIISDNKTKSNVFNCSKIDIKDEQTSSINKETKSIDIDIDIKETYHWDKEVNYIYELCEKISEKHIYVKTTFGVTKRTKINGKLNNKQPHSNKLTFRFNDKLEIIMGGKKISIEEFKKICELKKVKIECEFNFYSIVYKTQEEPTIINRLKLKKIKILEIKGEETQIKNFKSYDSLCETKNYVTKKEAVTNIMKLLAKQT